MATRGGKCSCSIKRGLMIMIANCRCSFPYKAFQMLFQRRQIYTKLNEAVTSHFKDTCEPLSIKAIINSLKLQRWFSLFFTTPVRLNKD